MAASLVHPNVATVYHVGEDAGELYMAMEYISSSFHALIIERGALPISGAVELVRQVVGAWCSGPGLCITVGFTSTSPGTWMPPMFRRCSPHLSRSGKACRAQDRGGRWGHPFAGM